MAGTSAGPLHGAGSRRRLQLRKAPSCKRNSPAPRCSTAPPAGRHLVEAVIRENRDLGRPQKVSLIFTRRITKRTPGTFHTRVITQGVIPALHVSYKSSKIKQYFKEGRALRTETTINNTRDFGIGRHLNNLPALRAIGFAANRRLLAVETLTQDCRLAEGLFDQAKLAPAQT
jgi:hypothetical protein